ncbi:uncharacterized protein LOC132057605 [Lycium ferocissimum]|uniref:uncharacterized protein LOC132057605 n=1 Tax=Lycium ferocissimum TaxID=112874 RepID=UPI0028159C6A|nr:uncharacterized protein LOC132057605 [Lycium ferocissimum]
MSADNSNTENTVATKFDHSHPYYLNASDSPGMNLINTIFYGRGFPGWRRSVLISLSAKKKFGFINGDFRPPDLNHVDYEQWACCNNMVITWLMNSLTKNIKDSVMYSKTTRELWESLESRFGKTNGAKLYHLQKELSGLT